MVLFPSALGIVFGGKLLEAVSGCRRWTAALLPFGRRPGRGVLVDHRRADDVDLFHGALAESIDGSVEDRGGDTFVLGQQVVGKFMKVTDATNARSTGNDLIDVMQQFA